MNGYKTAASVLQKLFRDPPYYDASIAQEGYPVPSPGVKQASTAPGAIQDFNRWGALGGMAVGSLLGRIPAALACARYFDKAMRADRLMWARPAQIRRMARSWQRKHPILSGVLPTYGFLRGLYYGSRIPTKKQKEERKVLQQNTASDAEQLRSPGIRKEAFINPRAVVAFARSAKPLLLTGAMVASLPHNPHSKEQYHRAITTSGAVTGGAISGLAAALGLSKLDSTIIAQSHRRRACLGTARGARIGPEGIVRFARRGLPESITRKLPGARFGVPLTAAAIAAGALGGGYGADSAFRWWDNTFNNGKQD